MNLRDAIRAFRHVRGWSQAELAVKAGVSVGQVAQVERGGKPSAKTIRKLADAVSADEWELLALAGMLPEELGEMFRQSRQMRRFMKGVLAIGGLAEEAWDRLRLWLIRYDEHRELLRARTEEPANEDEIAREQQEEEIRDSQWDDPEWDFDWRADKRAEYEEEP